MIRNPFHGYDYIISIKYIYMEKQSFLIITKIPKKFGFLSYICNVFLAYKICLSDFKYPVADSNR